MIQRSVVLVEGMATLRQYKDWLDAQAEALALQHRATAPNGEIVPLDVQVRGVRRFYARYLSLCERGSFAFRIQGSVTQAEYDAFRAITDDMHYRMTSEMPTDRKEAAEYMDVYWQFLCDLLRDENAPRSQTH